MGYTTDFSGSISIDPPLTLVEYNALVNFADERHEGKDYPSYYCQWIPTEDGTALEWDGGEKFYYPVQWMEYLIEHFLKDNHTLNGVIDAQGEEADDRWRLIVKDNVVTEQVPRLVWED